MSPKWLPQSIIASLEQRSAVVWLGLTGKDGVDTSDRSVGANAGFRVAFGQQSITGHGQPGAAGPVVQRRCFCHSACNRARVSCTLRVDLVSWPLLAVTDPAGHGLARLALPQFCIRVGRSSFRSLTVFSDS